MREDAAVEKCVELVLDEPGLLGRGGGFGVGDEACRVPLVTLGAYQADRGE